MLDQTSRYSDLNLKEEDLIAAGNHVLTAYKMKPKPGFFDYIGTASHFCAESSTGTNVQVVTTDDFTKDLDAICYFVDEEKELMKIAYPVDLFDRNISDGRAMVVGTIIKPKLGLRSQPFADACYQFWLGGDFIKNDEPQGNQVYAPMREITPLVADATSLRQAYTAWQEGVDLIDYAKEHQELRGALETFHEDADMLYPGWREKLGAHRRHLLSGRSG